MKQKPWKRQPDETNDSYAAFLVYLRSVKSSHKAVAEATGTPLTTIGQWSCIHKWTERKKAFEVEAQNEIADKILRERKRLAIMVQDAFLKRLDHARASQGEALKERMAMLRGTNAPAKMKAIESILSDLDPRLHPQIYPTLERMEGQEPNLLEQLDRFIESLPEDLAEKLRLHLNSMKNE